MERQPIVAGVFYQGNAMALTEQVQSLFTHREGPEKEPVVKDQRIQESFGLIMPHAGYMASGPVAAWGLVEAAKKGRPDSIVILGPSHTGTGMPVSVWDKGTWVTPFGTVDIDEALASQFLDQYDYASANYDAHKNEHSIEIQLPLLQYVYGRDIKVLPIAMMDQRRQTAMEIGRVFAALKEKKRILFIASTDLNHYESEEITRQKDEEVISHICSSNVERLYSSITEHDISMCGFGPVSALLSADLGKARMIKHSTSGVMTGDYSHVVGYVAAILEGSE